VDLDDILYGGDDIECYLDSILFNHIASIIPTWRTLRWVQLLNRLVDSDEILYGGVLKVTAITPKWRMFKLLWWRNF
jgi:hypothetical protein